MTTNSKNDNEASVAAWKAGRKAEFEAALGPDLNWHLAFDDLTEKETQRHVHGLHPYLGRYIPDLPKYFLGDILDEHKQDVWFKPGDVVLDFFAGSGTTIIQAAEAGIHGVGIDVSYFNTLLCNVKLRSVDLAALEDHIDAVCRQTNDFIRLNGLPDFEREADALLKDINDEHYPKGAKPVFPDSKSQQAAGDLIAAGMAGDWNKLEAKYGIAKHVATPASSFVEKWFPASVRAEFDFAKSLVDRIPDPGIQAVFTVILSRTMRSCRATTHYDLATLNKKAGPVTAPYYCWKHDKVCRPIASVRTRFERYARDTLKRLTEFRRLRSKTSLWSVVAGDSRNADIPGLVRAAGNGALADLIEKKGIRGVFSSPPYLGTIDYHETHAYAYELFNFDRRDEDEIGPLFKGKGKQAQAEYVDGISKVLLNAAEYMVPDYDVFLVANDKAGLYPEIADRAGMQIVKTFLRPVLNRAERDKKPYAESIFHLKSK